MIRKQTVTLKTVGDCDVRVDVYRPAGGATCPAVLWLHGGALIFGDRSAISPGQLPLYLEAGFAIVAADYRLAPEAKVEAIIEDLRDAYAWVRQTGPAAFGIDPSRIAVVGHSAGGYLTLISGVCVDPRPRALVSFYGYGDIASAWYSRPSAHYCQEPLVPEAEARRGVRGRVIAGAPFGSPQAETRGRFYLYCRQQGVWPQEVTGHDPDAEPSWFDPFCPLRNVTAAYPPTLLIHGDEDTDVPFEQSALMAEELARHGVEHQFLALRGSGHGFDGAGMGDPTVDDVFRKVLAFLAEHLGS
jgi:acetyl esterase/lipase